MKVKFYLTASGRSPVEEFLHGLSQSIRTDYFDAVTLLSKGERLTMPLSRNLSDIYRGLHELRFKDRGGQVRFFYYIKKGDAIYMVHAFQKKTQTIPKKEKKIILKRLRRI